MQTAYDASTLDWDTVSDLAMKVSKVMPRPVNGEFWVIAERNWRKREYCGTPIDPLIDEFTEQILYVVGVDGKVAVISKRGERLYAVKTNATWHEEPTTIHRNELPACWSDILILDFSDEEYFNRNGNIEIKSTRERGKSLLYDRKGAGFSHLLKEFLGESGVADEDLGRAQAALVDVLRLAMKQAAVRPETSASLVEPLKARYDASVYHADTIRDLAGCVSRILMRTRPLKSREGSWVLAVVERPQTKTYGLRFNGEITVESRGPDGVVSTSPANPQSLMDLDFDYSSGRGVLNQRGRGDGIVQLLSQLIGKGEENGDRSSVSRGDHPSRAETAQPTGPRAVREDGKSGRITGPQGAGGPQKAVVRTATRDIQSAGPTAALISSMDYEESVLNATEIRNLAKGLAVTLSATNPIADDDIWKFYGETHSYDKRMPEHNHYVDSWEWLEWGITAAGDIVYRLRVLHETVSNGHFSEEKKTYPPRPLSNDELLMFDTNMSRGRAGNSVIMPFKGFGITGLLNGLLPAPSRAITSGAEAGIPGDMVALAECYFYGTGIRIDFKRAAALYQQAAQAGNSHGQCGVGVCYLLGCGLTQNMTKAQKYLTLAATQGNASAKTLLARDFGVTI